MAKTKTPATPPSTTVYLVSHCEGIDSAHASHESAKERVKELEDAGKDAIKIDEHELVGGTVNVVAEPEPEVKKPAAKKATKSKSEATEAEEAPKKKTKPVAEQKADNAKKGKKPTDQDLPAQAKTLLAGNGNTLEGMNICVTGVPPTLGRKNAEALVTQYGGKLQKALSKTTTYVCVGNEAGPKKYVTLFLFQARGEILANASYTAPYILGYTKLTKSIGLIRLKS